MKKFIPALVMAVSLTACQGNSHDVSATDSAIAHTADSLKTVMDSAAVKVDSTIKAAADTVELKINQAVDSARKAVKK